MQASPQTLLEHIPHPKETSHAPCLLLPPALISFLSPRICPIWGFHKMKADHMGSFWDWLLSLSITFPKLYPWCTLDAHGVPFSWPSNTPPLSHARSFIHSTADGRLCSFHVLALLSHVAVAMPVPGLCAFGFPFLGGFLGAESLGHRVHLLHSRNRQAVSHGASSIFQSPLSVWGPSLTGARRLLSLC